MLYYWKENGRNVFGAKANEKDNGSTIPSDRYKMLINTNPVARKYMLPQKKS